MILSSGPSQRKLVLIESIRVCAWPGAAMAEAAIAASRSLFMDGAPVSDAVWRARCSAFKAWPDFGPWPRQPCVRRERKLLTRRQNEGHGVPHRHSSVCAGRSICRNDTAGGLPPSRSVVLGLLRVEIFADARAPPASGYCCDRAPHARRRRGPPYNPAVPSESQNDQYPAIAR